MQNNSHKLYSKQKLYTYILLIFHYEKSCFFAINFNCEPVVKEVFFFGYIGQIAKDAISHHVFFNC